VRGRIYQTIDDARHAVRAFGTRDNAEVTAHPGVLVGGSRALPPGRLGVLAAQEYHWL
jgi:hypothetical protein